MNEQARDSTCPEEEAYLRFLEGEVTVVEGEKLLAHLRRCQKCSRMYRQLPQSSHGSNRSVGSSDNTTYLGDAPPGDAPSHRQPAPRCDFLAPAQSTEEMGWLGEYRVFEILGRGGMGIVFRAEDTRLKRPVALKVLLPHLTEDLTARARFTREAETAARLVHDHIITIYEVGEVPHPKEESVGVLFLAMQLLEGETLDKRLRREHLLSASEVIRLGAEVASGLAMAHDSGVIHRDLKPGNVWLQHSPGKPLPRAILLDFGLAKALEGDIRLTRQGAILGTPAFMSPEQAGGEPLDPRSDLFSLGAVLYEMATGQLPFQGEDPLSTLFNITVSEPSRPKQLNPQIPEALSRLILQLLSKNREERPQHASQVAKELNGIASRERLGSGSSRPPWQRSRWMRWTCTGAILLLVTMLLLSKMPPLVPGPTGKPYASSPLDRLQRTNISRTNLIHAGMGDETKAPKPLVAFIGSGILKHWGPVRAVTTDPFSNQILSVGDDGALCFWDLGTGHLKRSITAHPRSVRAVAVSRDGALVATGDRKGEIKIWNLFSGAPVTTLMEHRDAITGLSFGGNRLLASSSKDQSVRLWDLEKRQAVQRIGEHRGVINGVALSRNEEWLVSAGRDKVAIVWDIKSKKVITRFEKHEGSVTAVAIAPDENTIVTCGYDSKVRVWNRKNGEQLQELTNKEGLYLTVAISPNGNRIAASGSGQKLLVWDATSGKMIHSSTGHTTQVTTLCFADDHRVVTAGEDHGIRVWRGEKQELSGGPEGRGGLTSLALSEKPLRLVTGNRDRHLRLYDLNRGFTLSREESHPDQVLGVAISRNGNRIASIAMHGRSRMWDLVGERMKWGAVEGAYGNMVALDFHPNGNEMVTVHTDGKARRWDLEEGKITSTFVVDDLGVTSIRFSSDGEHLLTGCQSLDPSKDLGALRLWRHREDKPLWSAPGALVGITAVAWSRDGHHVAAGCSNGSIQIRNAKTGKVILTLKGHQAPVRSIAFGSTGRLLVSGGDDGAIRVYDAKKGAQIHLHQIGPGRGTVSEIRFAPDGRHLFTANGNGSCYVLRLDLPDWAR